MTNSPVTDMVAEAITEYYGERCPDKQAGCPCCDAWEQYDALSAAQERIETLDKLLAQAREDAIREAADIVSKNRDISGWVSHDAILALLNDGGQDE